MNTQTFEQAFKEIFKNELKDIITNREIIVANDISAKPLEKHPNGIVCIIQSGNGRMQEVKGYDLTTYPCVITFMFDMNYLQEFLGLIQFYIAQNNGIVKTLTYNKNASETGSYDYVMNTDSTPSMLSNPSDLRLKNKNVKIATVMFTTEIRYTSSADITIPSFWLKLTKSDNSVVEQEIKGVGLVSTDSATVPEYETFFVYGQQYAHRVPICLTTAITLQIAQIKDSAFDLLLQQVAEGITYLKKVEYKTANILDTYKEYGYQITHGYSQGVKIFDIVLTR